MSLATVASRALAGIDAPEVAVEVHLGPGLPSFTIVGLPDTEVREAKDRVRAAHRPPLARQGKFTREFVSRERLGRDLSARRKNADRDRQIEAAGILR